MEENIKQKGWFSRNWKWAVPTGGCLIIIILLIVFAGSLFLGLTSIIKESSPYQEALSSTTTNELVIDRLGEPIVTDGMISGKINYSGDSGQANLEIPIKGPKGKATIHVIGFKENDQWSYQTLKVYIENSNEEVDLLLTQNNLK